MFLRPIAGALLKQTPKVVSGIARGTLRSAPVVLKPVREFGRGLFGGGPRYTPIAGSQGAREATVYAFTRAGMQTRYVAVQATKYAAIRAPLTTIRGIQIAAKWAVRDAVVTPYSIATYTYGGFRFQRIARGSTSLVERGIDKGIYHIGAGLTRIGLQPGLTGVSGTAVRGAILGGVIKGSDYTMERINAAEKNVTAAFNNYKAIHNSVRDRVVSAVPPVPVDTTERERHIPLGAVRTTAPSAPVRGVVIPVPSGRDSSQRGATKVIPVPVRQTR